jgi:hypothetical protein
MAYTPPVGDAVQLNFSGAYTPPLGSAVVLQPATGLRFLSIGMDQAWGLMAPTFAGSSLAQAWSLVAPRFLNAQISQAWSLTAPQIGAWPLNFSHTLFAPVMADHAADFAWSSLAAEFHEIQSEHRWRLFALSGGNLSLTQQWSLEATAVWTKVISATAYLFTLEHPDEGISEFPISNFSGQMRSGENSYLQCSIPNASAYADAITLYAAHEDTEMAISAGYRWSDGSYSTQEIARTTLRNFRQDYGSRSNTISLDGLDTRTNLVPKSVTLTGASYRSVATTGLRRYRCAMDFSVRPGDTVTVNDETFIVGELSYQVDAENATMEVAETVPA